MASNMNWQEIEGWFSSGDADFVAKVCEKIKGGTVVELGCYAGKSTAVMAPICKRNVSSFIAIDNFWGTDPKDPATQNQRDRDMQAVFRNNMKKMGLLDYIEVHKLDSAASAQLFVDGTVDFCFIDASHVEEDVVKDIDAWWPKIREGGTLAGHDYTWGSVKNATRAFIQAHGFLKLVVSGNCWKVIKKEQK